MLCILKSRACRYLVFLFLISQAWAQESQSAIFQNPNLPPEQRSADLVSRMTLQEKVLQMQNSAPAIPRLGIPAYDWWNEALHGVARAGRATVFPQAIGLAATFDTDLMHRVADAISTEARAKYNQSIRDDDHRRYHGLTFWSPNINIFRDPRWGRGQETYGEDPFLTARMAVAFIQGMQGSDPHYLKTVATAKHFAVHSGPEPLRHSFDVHPSTRDLEETYLPAFRASIVEGKADSVMCAYNSVNGDPACVSPALLQDHLRGAWGFQGYVVSDCSAISNIVRGHKYKPDLPEAAAAAVKAGTDLTCGDEYASLVEAVKRGLITEPEIDRALQRLFTARMKLGMFDPAERVPYAAIPYSENDSPEHRQLALEAARKSIVLLKNNQGILPLKTGLRRITVIGPAADDPDTMMANYNGVPSSLITPLEGMRRQFGSEAEVRFALGSSFSIVSYSPLSTEALTPPTNPGRTATHGLLAEYFSNPDFQGKPVLSRVEPRVYLQREVEEAAVESQLPRNGYAVRWSATLRPPYTGAYQISVIRLRCGHGECPAEDSARVFLDDRQVIANEMESGRRHSAQYSSVDLIAGHDYRLRVEYRQRTGGVGVKFVWRPPAEPLLAEALKAVKDSDVTVAFLGLNAQLEGEEMPISIPGFSGGDRTSLGLPQPQGKLLEAAIQTGKPVVVVLVSGSALAVDAAEEQAAAILQAWYGGEEAGTAIAQTLAGNNNPAGRLPVTFYRSAADLPAFEDYAMEGRTYRYFTGKPLYPFGYGLSYATFRYPDFHIERTAGDNGQIRVSARVENLSQRDGDEVVQVYVSREPPGLDDPIRQLRGFKRIHLAAGESRIVEFDLDPAPCPTARSMTVWRCISVDTRGRSKRAA